MIEGRKMSFFKKKSFGCNTWHVGILVPRPGNPTLCTGSLESFNRWTTVEVLGKCSLPQRHILFQELPLGLYYTFIL